MPAATTHAEFARQVYSSMPEELRDSITSLPMYYLGSQGPDLFFFHGYMFLPGSLNSLGSRLHEERVKETITFLTTHASTPALHSYVLGFLTHYALDSHCHPIINAYSLREAKEKSIPELEAHFRMEGELDAWMLRQQGRSVKDYNVYQSLKVSRQEAKELGRMYHALFQKVFGENVKASAIERACYDTARITRQLKVGKRTQSAIYAAESLIRMPHLVSGMILTDKEGAFPELLNHGHKVWNYYGESRKSFPELMEEAGKYALKLMEHPDPDLIRCNFNGEPLPRAIL